MAVIARNAYECTVCGALWPHPSFRCSGIGGFADHAQAETRLVKVVDDDDYRGAVDLVERARGCVTAALNCTAHPWHGDDRARKWLMDADRLGGQ
jgi:hypothetical protein